MRKLLISMVCLLLWMSSSAFGKTESLLQEISFADMEGSKQFELVFCNKDIEGNDITDREFIDAVVKLFQSRNKYNFPERKDKRFLFDIWDIRNFYVEAISEAGNFTIKYITKMKVRTRTMGGSVYDSEKQPSSFYVKFPYKIMKENEQTRIIISFPDKGILAINEDVEPMVPVNELKKDTIRIFNEASTMKGFVKKSYFMKGEVNSQFNDTSTYANFLRILGQYKFDNSVKVDDIRKKNTFTFKYKNTNLPLYIQVYPYRNGSKVVYEVEIPYEVNSQGGISITKEDIDSIKKQIEKIAND